MLILLSLLIHQWHSSAISWDYNEPPNDVSNWIENYPECGHTRQSPINIITDNPEVCTEPIELSWISEPTHFGIRNNGHTIHAIPLEIDHRGGSDISGLEILHHTNDTNIRLKNLFYNTYKSRVNAEYCFDSLHFHWGETNTFGSEHAIDNTFYPLEVHLVHYSCDYNTIGPALTAFSNGNLSRKYDDDNILAVIGVLFEIGNEPNIILDKILADIIHKALIEFHDPEDAHDGLLQLYYTQFDMIDLLPQNKEIIAYKGSLTTPPCFETVRWHVMKETMSVTQEQLDLFRMILESTHLNDSMAPNWRPLQELYNRTQYKCMDNINKQIVEKDAISNVAEIENGMYNYYSEYINWFTTAVIFICLFFVSVVIIGILIFVMYNKMDSNENTKEYEKARSNSTYDKTKEMNPLNGNNNVTQTNDYH